MNTGHIHNISGMKKPQKLYRRDIIRLLKQTTTMIMDYGYTASGCAPLLLFY